MPTCMRQEMILQISLLGETFGTLSAAKGPCALMDMRVTSKIARRGECLVTVRTFVRFLLGKQFLRLSKVRRTNLLWYVSFDGSRDSN